MSQLRSCYFCGAVGDSLRESDVLPDRLVSTESAPTAVLCSTCREKLRRVLEPLDDRSAPDPSASSDPSAPGYSSREVTFESGDSTDGVSEDTEADANGAPDDGDADAGEDGVTDDGDADADETTHDGLLDDGADADANTTSNGRRSTDADGADVPDGYYKVLRLLQNREFPMERADLTALVTGAYDVSEPQCERILETAVERGVLVEDGSTVDIGRN